MDTLAMNTKSVCRRQLSDHHFERDEKGRAPDISSQLINRGMKRVRLPLYRPLADWDSNPDVRDAHSGLTNHRVTNSAIGDVSRQWARQTIPRDAASAV